MNWLRIISAIIAISIYLYFGFETLRFKKEFKGAVHDDRSLSDRFVHKWEKKLTRGSILIAIATIFGIIAIIFS